MMATTTAPAIAQAPQGSSVADYHVRGLRLWSDGRSPHGPRHRCLICSDTRAYLKREQPEPHSIAELIARGVVWLKEKQL